MQSPNMTVRFHDLKSALRHLAHHVLTPPESQAWGIVWKDRFPSLGHDSAALKWCSIQRDAIAPAFRESVPADEVTIPEELELLLRTYVDAITSQIENSMRLGWTVKHRTRAASFDTNGIFSATAADSENVVVSTAFVPGCGTADSTRQSQSSPSDPHARCRSMSKMRGHDRDERPRAGRNGITARRAQRRAAGWTWEEKLYYLVFRPAMQFIRAWQPGIDSEARPNLQDLKPVLPRMSELKFERWRALRQEAST